MLISPNVEYKILLLHHILQAAPPMISNLSVKRDYDSAFGKVADILKRYGIVKSARNCVCKSLTQFPKNNGRF